MLHYNVNNRVYFFVPRKPFFFTFDLLYQDGLMISIRHHRLRWRIDLYLQSVVKMLFISSLFFLNTK